LPNAMYPILTTRQAPMAYSPLTKHFYAAGANWPFWMKRFEDPDYFVATSTGAGVKYEGLVGAMDSQTNKIVWEHVVPYRTQQNGSGFMATAGGLLFHGESDGLFNAYSAETGEILWNFQTGSSANNAASTYEADGEQYVAVTSSGGVWAFKLGGAAAPLPAPPTPPERTSFSGRILPTTEITMSAIVGDTGLVDEVRQTHDEYAFAPVRSRVGVGEKMTFKNIGKEPHSAIALDGSWTTGVIQPGRSKTLIFEESGVHTYRCDEHKFSYGELTIDE
jgi:plastocyanin